MDSKEFQAHIDARFDRLEVKMDAVGERSVAHEQQIRTLQGHSKTGFAMLLAVLGYLAKAFFERTA